MGVYYIWVVCMLQRSCSGQDTEATLRENRFFESYVPL
jgi:hypothetical protein